MSEATDSEYETYLAKWGMVLSVISAVFTSTGLCLQKMHLKKLKSSPDEVQSYADTKYIAGISYVAIGLLLKAPICVMLPQVTIALMSAQTVLYSSVLEFLFLKNHMSKVTAICLVSILLGIIIGVNGSTIGDPVYSFVEIWDLFFSFRAITFSLVCLACIFGMSEFMRVTQIEPSATLRLAQVSIVSGLVAGLFGTFTKAVFEVLYFNTYYSTSRTFSWNAWLYMLPAVGLGLLKMRSVSSALKEFPSWRFLPLYQSFAILMNAVCGLVYYDESVNTYHLHKDTYSSTYYFVGLLLVSGGVACLMLRHSDYKELNTLSDADMMEGKSLMRHTAGQGGVDSDDEEDEDSSEYEEYHISGGLNNLLPQGVGEYYGVMFGRSAANPSSSSSGNYSNIDNNNNNVGSGRNGNQQQQGGLSVVAAAERKAKNDYKAMFEGSMAKSAAVAPNSNKGGSGSQFESYHRLPDQVEL